MIWYESADLDPLTLMVKVVSSVEDNTFFKLFLSYSFSAYVGIVVSLSFSDMVLREISLLA
jgi:hypothetical protein